VVREAHDELDGTRVLVVDDDPPMLRTHGRVLDAHGLSPVLMADASEALEEAKNRTPAAIIIDLVMPGMSGLEYVTRLRCHYGRTCPPVILISGNHQYLSPMEQLMFDAIFPKPYSVDKVVYWVKRLAREYQERRRSPSGVVSRGGLRLVEDDEEGEM
jgi:DNA-binding response OmpR family regulator